MGVIDIGIFPRTFTRPTLEATLDAVAGHGLRWVQFNMESVGPLDMPDRIPPATVERIRQASAAREIRIAALSGTYNMIHPDPRVRDEGLARLRVLAAACRGLETSIITLCTGTRDPDNMWREHPDNDSPAAWRDLLASLGAALTIAEEYDVILGVEPEPGNVINSAGRCRDLLGELDSPHLKVVMDPANIIPTGAKRPPREVLDEAFDLLGEHVVVAHAKDRNADGAVRVAGRGIVPWDLFVARLAVTDFDGPLILHGLAEDEVDAAVAMLRKQIETQTA
jgi:sugar phosphate isomerase/epimerase